MITEVAVSRLEEVSAPPPVGCPILEVRNLTKDYPGPRRALDGVDIAVWPGQLVVVLGANGSGKSTLLRCIVRLVEPTAGAVRIAGTDMAHLRGSDLRVARRKVGMIFQQSNLVRRRTALLNVACGSLGRQQNLASALGWLPRTELREAAALLDRLGLLYVAHKRADTLSGGEAQRVAIARSLAQRPRVLLADEPVASLDPEATADVMLLLGQLASREQLGVLCVLHQPDLALRYAHRIIGLRAGRVVFDAPASRLDLDAVGALYRADLL